MRMGKAYVGKHPQAYSGFFLYLINIYTVRPPE